MAKRIYLMRHAEAESQEKDARLSMRGRFQAKLAADRLIEEYWHNNTPATFYHSPAYRAVDTQEIMGDEMKHQPMKRMTVVCSEVDERIQAGGVIGPLLAAGVPYVECVGHWLRNPKSVPGREPAEIARRIWEFISHLRSKKFEPMVVAITHEIPLAAFLNQCLHLEPEACGVANCEWLEIEPVSGYDHHNCLPCDDWQVVFRNKTYRLLE